MNKYIFFHIATILIFFSSCHIYGQVKLPGWEAGISSVGGFGRQAPFWVVSNRQGKYLPEKFAGLMELGLLAQRDTGKIIDYDYGLDLSWRVGTGGDLWLHRAYAGITINELIRLKAGSWDEPIGTRQSSLTSGSLIWSGNARPMPRIEIGTPGYIPVPWLRGYAEIKGLMSHGWFEEGRYASDVWLHHKNFYVRLGGELPVQIYYGFNHFAQWGGSSPRQDEPYPSDFKSFVKVFFIRKGETGDTGTPDGWVINRFGNHLGSRNYGIDLNMGKFSAGIYQQDIFEDNSGFSRRNFPDGLWGAWIRFPEENRTVQAVVYEFIHTTHQSGPYHDFDGDTLGGNDNYFNHGHYQSGWTYHRYIIGSPLITSPILNEPPVDRIRNNRVIAHHIGFEGNIAGNFRYRNFFTFSRNFGTYEHPFGERRDQFSWMLEFAGPLKFFDLEAGITLAADFGKMYGDNFGVIFKIKKSGSFRK